MLEILELLNELHEEDVEWIFSEGVEQNVIANTVIIREGEVPDSIFFVLQGLLGVQNSAISSQPLRLLGLGEVVGEMSYLEKEAASANVTALEVLQMSSIDSTPLFPFMCVHMGGDAQIKQIIGGQ